MTNVAQPTLFPAARRPIEDVDVRHAGFARASDPETSRVAARVVSEGVERLVFMVHNDLFGLTDDELCWQLPRVHGPTVKSARSRLTKRGLLVDGGERRPSTRGRDMIVWRVA